MLHVSNTLLGENGVINEVSNKIWDKSNPLIYSEKYIKIFKRFLTYYCLYNTMLL